MCGWRSSSFELQEARGRSTDSAEIISLLPVQTFLDLPASFKPSHSTIQVAVDQTLECMAAGRCNKMVRTILAKIVLLLPNFVIKFYPISIG